MKLFLISSFIYLIGVVLVLYFKPKLMFDEKGNWKEFGFVQNQKYTWFPFWLFCILWAVLSFALINLMLRTKPPKVKSSCDTMKPGYYVLDKEKTLEQGFPKYMYLGPEVPE